MRRLRAAALSEVELAMDIINQAKAHLRAQGIDQWQTGYPDRDCLERDVRTGKGYFLEEDGIPLQSVPFQVILLYYTRLRLILQRTSCKSGNFTCLHTPAHLRYVTNTGNQRDHVLTGSAKS